MAPIDPTEMLYRAVRHGSLADTREAIGKGALVNAWSHNYYSPLHFAVLGTSTPIVKLLLDQGARIDAVDMWMNTPLHHAANAGTLACVQLLLDRGADIEAKNTDGETALDRARNHNRTKVVSFITDLVAHKKTTVTFQAKTTKHRSEQGTQR
jgi:ankyrin repeat protein